MTGGLLPDDIETLARRVVEENAALGRKVTVAESCTGGLIVAALTDVPGASRVVNRGFVTYADDAKMELLNVPLKTLRTEGAVSSFTAVAMAQGALAYHNIDCAAAVTGVAGPGGGTVEKPIGLVYIAVAKRGHEIQCKEYSFGEIGRDKVRLATVKMALEMLKDLAEL